MNKLTEKGCIWMAAFLLLIAMTVPVVLIHYSRQLYMQQQLAVIGEVEETHPEWTKEYLQILYGEKMNEDIQKKGQEALEKYAYTSQGISILADRTVSFGILPVLAGTDLLLLLLIAVLVIRWLKMDHEEHRRLQEQLFFKQQEADRLAGAQSRTEKVKSYVENIAHQIKTPLSRGITSLELLERQLSSDSQTKRIEECISHLEEIRTLVTRLLEIGRMEMGSVLFHYDPFLLRDLLADAAASVNGRKEVRICIEPPQSDTVWSGDYRWMKEAVSNLIENALEHDPSGEPVEIICTEEKEYYRLTIRDHGRGFQSADLDFLFDRFYVPVTEKKGHTGIGLNLAKLIIDGHHGTIHAENHPEGGACFTICLPRYSAMKNGSVTVL